MPQLSPRSYLVTLLLCVFLGPLGVHRFYVGKVGTGVLMFFTMGLFGIWWLVDLLIVAAGSFTDAWGGIVRWRSGPGGRPPIRLVPNPTRE